MSGERIPMIPQYRVVPGPTILAEVVDYNHKMMNVPAMWKDTKGEGVRVAVLDTGVPEHVDLKPMGGKSFIAGYREDKNGHGCVSPDTLVHTNFCGIETIQRLYGRVSAPEQSWASPDGSVGVVKDVRGMGIKTYALDEETGAAVVAPVEFLHRTKVSGKVVSVSLEGGISYRLTPWHEVCVLVHRHHDKYEVRRKRADELDAGDRMIFSTGDVAGRLVEEPYRVSGSPYRECARCGHIPSSYKQRTSRCQCKKCGAADWKEMRRSHLVTEDWAYLAGLVVTDGHISERNVRVEISSETPEILEAAIAAASRLGFIGRIDEPKGRCSRVIFGSKEMVDAMLSMGISSSGKTYQQRLPEFVGKSPFAVICAFIAGVVDGDGCVSETNTKNRITTASFDFAHQMAALLNSLGISSGVQDYGPSGGFGRDDASGANVLNVMFSGLLPEVVAMLAHPVKKERGGRELRHRRKARRISSVGREEWDGDFFDFTVSSHHTYLGNGHFVSNTHCGGIIAAIANNGMGVAGVAPQCEDYYGAVLDGSGNGTIQAIIDGIRWGVDVVGAKVISMSLGIPAGYQNFKKLEQACIYAREQGVAVIVAAGNEAGGVGQPACYDSTIAVAAINSEKDKAWFSNTGPEVTFAAGGVDVYSTYLNNGYAKLSGTSMACPALAGIATLIIADEKNDHDRWLSPDELVEKMKKICLDLGDSGFDETFGHGMPVFSSTGEPDEPEGEQPPEEPPEEPPDDPDKGKPSPCDLSAIRVGIEAASKAIQNGKPTDIAISEGLVQSGKFLARVRKESR